MPKRTVTLTDHFQRFIDDAVASGRYADASDLVRDALRLLEQREREDATKLQRLREMTSEALAAIDQGDFVELGTEDLPDYFERKDADSARRARDDAA
jgi:antitoxin ParD1/3/4